MQKRIRWVQIRDLARVMELEKNCFEKPWEFDAFYMLAIGRGHLKDRAIEVEMAVYESDGEVIGYTVWECNLSDKRGHVLNIAVQKECRRQGIATLLLGFVLEDLRQRNAVSCFLEVREHNLPARKLYEKMGFVYSSADPVYFTRAELY